MVRAQLESVLAGYGVARMNATHTVFDPSIHEAVSVHPVRNAAQHGIVVDEVEPGYLFGNRLLRPAKVVVGRLSDGRST